MGGINYEDSPPDCYNNFEDAEMFLPVFGEESVAESCVQYDLGFTVEEKSVVGEEVYGEYGFTVKEEEVLAKFKGFFARRELAKAAAERKKKRKAEERDKEREALQKAERSKKKKEEEQEVKENGKELMEDAKKEGAGTRDVKQRIADAVSDKQEAVGVTTAIQEDVFLEMGVDNPQKVEPETYLEDYPPMTDTQTD